ncbi:MAG: hypothetical protein K8R56_00350, partial [Candidatus Eisenbacteria bacterium]|nr:hypothetical protein [Candidatus Eisenbacteria bacterium]
AALAGATQRVKAMKEALNRSTTPDTKLDDRARAIERKLADMDLRLNGDFEREENFNEGGPISIANRIRTATRTSASYGPTPNLRSSLDIGKQEFATLRAELDALLNGELPALEKDLDAAGAPWTPGRGVGR